MVDDRSEGALCSMRSCPTANVLDPASGSVYRALTGSLVTVDADIVVTETNGDGAGAGTSNYRAYVIR
ncbi:hypothetical protein [Plantactinospora sp. WMMB782]|uniref:hypothetical protein n=1 Tax=Plantactinospora sp. WMMB782 TaxID=3404121 RepID=UPI003B962FE5